MPETSPTGVGASIRNLRITAGGQPLLEAVDADFPACSVTLVVGPSGVGKSLLLRAVAGLLSRSSPEISVEGQIRIGDAASSSNPRPGDAGFVFQSLALFDEWSPLDNVRFAVAHRPAGRVEDDRSAENWLEELNVPPHTRPAALSGGQRQRLALARALAYGPDLLLYDEPTTGLDPAAARRVANLIRQTHDAHPRTAVIVTHDYDALTPIADKLYLLDPSQRTLREIPREDWIHLAEMLNAPPQEKSAPREPTILRRIGRAAGNFLIETSRCAEAAVQFPLDLIPRWRSLRWGLRFLCHSFGLVADFSAWIYLIIAGVVLGFVTTYFTFRFLPYARYTEPLLVENLLGSMGFALYRILVPVLGTILIAARCGAAVASDVGGKAYSEQLGALETFRAPPKRYLLTGILLAFLVSEPLLTTASFFAAKWTSLLVFAAIRPEWGPDFWDVHFHRELRDPAALFPLGSGWMLSKVLCCAAGTARIAYALASRPKRSSRDVSAAVTSTILWATLFVLLIHFLFAFYEFG